MMAAAQLKLKAALPAELADRTGRIQQRFLLDAPSWYDDGDTSPFLPAVADAVWNQGGRLCMVQLVGERLLLTRQFNNS